MFCYCEAEPFCNTCYQINALYLWAHMIPSDSKIKLPKLTIPPFEGDITKWTPFWDSAIHRNSSLTEINKFNYLRSLLRGTARESVAGLMLTAVNYDEAIAILKKHYGNKQAIISRHMDTLMGLEAVMSNNNTKALRHLYDMVESNIRSCVPWELQPILMATSCHPFL